MKFCNRLENYTSWSNLFSDMLIIIINTANYFEVLTDILKKFFENSMYFVSKYNIFVERKLYYTYNIFICKFDVLICIAVYL